MPMSSFFTRLAHRARSTNSLLTIGLDPHPELLEEASPGAALDFCLRLIEATSEMACAFKPNSAFFERYGAQGVAVLEHVITAIPQEIPVILDAKRGDIASTAQAYAHAAFTVLGADAITVHPLLGQDSLEPFLADPAHGVFLLCKTSNPSADELQSLLLSHGEPFYVYLARLAQQWNKRDNLGLVVGATDVAALAAARAAATDLWFLSPGVGAQRAELEPALRAGLRADGLGMLISVSRGLAASPQPKQEAQRLRDAINRVRDSLAGPAPTAGMAPSLAALADDLLHAGCVRFGDFTLKSGLNSPIYFDLRLLASFPRLLARAAAAYQPILAPLTFDRLAALPYAALPIATALALQTGRPLIYPRKETKEYGTGAAVEGAFSPGETAVVIDDLATTGGSKFEAIARLTAAGLKVQDVVVLIDRQSGAREALAAAGFRLHAVFTLTELLDLWEAGATVPSHQIAQFRAFLSDSARG